MWRGESPKAEADINRPMLNQRDHWTRLGRQQRKKFKTEQKEHLSKRTRKQKEVFASGADSLSSFEAERIRNKRERNESGKDFSKSGSEIDSRYSGSDFRTTSMHSSGNRFDTEAAGCETEVPPKKRKRQPDFKGSENECGDGGSECSRGVRSGTSRDLSSGSVENKQQRSEADGVMKNDGHAGSSNNNYSPAPLFIIPRDSIKDFHFSDYEPGSYERVARRRRKWLRDNWSVEDDLSLLGDCTPLIFCQCHRPSKRAAVLAELNVPVLDPSHLKELRNMAQEEDFKVTFYGTAVHVKGNEYDYLVTYHDPGLPMHNTPPLLTHALSLAINQSAGVEELVGVDVEQVAVVTTFAGYTLFHYSQHTKLNALERLHILAQVMKAVRRIHDNNHVHNNIRLSSVCLAPEGRCSATGRRNFKATLTDFTLCRQRRTPLLRDTGDNPGFYPWMCPEVLRGARCSEYSDVYSVGRLAAILETRRYPYPGNLKTWVADATASKSLVRQPLRRGLRYVQRFTKALLELHRRHPLSPEAENESLGGTSEG